MTKMHHEQLLIISHNIIMIAACILFMFIYVYVSCRVILTPIYNLMLLCSRATSYLATSGVVDCYERTYILLLLLLTSFDDEDDDRRQSTRI